MADRNKENGNGHIPYTRAELNDLLSSGLRQVGLSATRVLPSGRELNNRAADHLCQNGLNDAGRALRVASRQRLKLDKVLAFQAYKMGVDCTLFNVDSRLLQRNVELARI